jgi:hypothetical protein
VNEPPDLRDLVGDDLPPEELDRLARVDALLRAVPAPPAEVPPSVTGAVMRAASVTPLWTRRRVAGALAFAAALAALFFGIGAWTTGGGFDARATVALQATEKAAGASGFLKLGSKNDANGNWEMEIVVSGLPTLPEGGYYVLWLARDGKYAGTCGTFNVGGGTTTVRLTASYVLSEYDEWVVTAWLPDRDNAKAPWLLTASTRV